MAELNSLSLLSDANLQAYYRLEDINDSKDSHTLTNNNTVAFNAAKYNNGADFGASNTNKSLYRATNFTIDGGANTFSCWVKLTTEIGSGKYSIFDHRSSATTNIITSIDYEYNAGTRRLTFHRVKLSVVDNAINYTITLGTTAYYHLAITYNATDIIAYVNAVNVGTIGSTGNGTGAQSAQFSLGSTIDPVQFLSGIIDDTAIFDRALTAAEILTVFIDQGGSKRALLGVGL